MPGIWMILWPTAILTHPTSYFVATLGGTGATLMFCAMCAFIAKSKQLRKEKYAKYNIFPYIRNRYGWRDTGKNIKILYRNSEMM